MTIEGVAIGLYAVWLVSEISILRPARDRSGSDPDRKSMLFLASSNLVAPLLAIAVHIFGVGSAPFSAQAKFLGIALMLTGFVTRWAGMWTLRKFFSANVAVQSDHRLVIRGPYKLVRHPGYFGGWLAFLGFGISLGNWIALFVLAVLTIPAFLYRIKVEEQVLRAAFPDYVAYAERVKKFIPLVW
jgi:protein-S-isoprenylcysteine O-methyltransferase Ste14